MPAGQVRPRASQVPALGQDAVAVYQRSGWQVTESGHVDLGSVTGPCAGCQRRDHIRYGPAGRPLCEGCTTKSTRQRPAVASDGHRIEGEASDYPND